MGIIYTSKKINFFLVLENMLPKDIANIIDDYKEPGIFIYQYHKICWFNGKRVEDWCALKNGQIERFNGKKFEYWYVLDVFTFENDLYILGRFRLFKYKNKDFIKSEAPQIWNHPLYVFSEQHSKYISQIIYQNRVYRQDLNSIIQIINDKSSTILPSKFHQQYGIQLMIYDEYIYSFGFQNEKFDLKTQIWIKLKESGCYGTVYLVNNKLFRWDFSKCYTYNKELDLWEIANF